MSGSKPDEKFRYLYPASSCRRNIAEAARIVDGEARDRGIFQDVHPRPPNHYNGRPSREFLKALKQADVMWFADEDVQNILQDKIADLDTQRNTRQESNVISLALKALYAISVEFATSYKVLPPYNQGDSDRGGWSDLPEINKERVVVGREYRIWRFERRKSSNICFDDDYFVVSPDGIPGICKPYRVIATAALFDHWEGSIIETRQGRGMDAVASDEKERFIPVLKEGAMYNDRPGHSTNPIFVTGDAGRSPNAILDLRSKDFLYDELICPLDAKMTTESHVRFFDLKKTKNHEDTLASRAIRETNVTQTAVEQIITMGCPASGTRYNIVDDQVLVEDVSHANSGRHRVPLHDNEPHNGTTMVRNPTSRIAESHDGLSPPSTSRDRQEERRLPPGNQAALQRPLHVYRVSEREDVGDASWHEDRRSQLHERLENSVQPQQYVRLDRRGGNDYQPEQGPRRDLGERNGYQSGRDPRLERTEENRYRPQQAPQFDHRWDDPFQHVPQHLGVRLDHYNPSQRGRSEAGRSRADERYFSTQGSNAFAPTQPSGASRRRRGGETVDSYSGIDQQTYPGQGTRRWPDTPHKGDSYRPQKRTRHQ